MAALLSPLLARCEALRHHPAVVRTCHHAEYLGNLALVAATGVHEWGNEVGLCCVPLAVVLVVNFVISLGEPAPPA